MSQDNQPGFTGIRIVGCTGKVSNNEVRFSGPGTGISIDSTGSDGKGVDVLDNRVEQHQAKSNSWWETYMVDVLSGSTVLAVGIFCAWLGLKS